MFTWSCVLGDSGPIGRREPGDHRHDVYGVTNGHVGRSRRDREYAGCDGGGVGAYGGREVVRTVADGRDGRVVSVAGDQAGNNLSAGGVANDGLHE